MGIVVLSLFDGCACARVALERLHIPIDTYYASEIDKYAIKIANKNYPDIIQLGDIKNWSTWNIKTPDLIIGGSPCQDLSVAGTRAGLAGERSRLFYEFINIYNFYTPRYVLLENVASMSRFNEWLFSFYMRVPAVKINSALVSAQHRQRLYWTNTIVPSPEDKHIYLKDIIESGAVDRDKSYCIDANYYKGTNYTQYITKRRRQIVYLPEQLGYIKQNHRGSRVYSIEGKSVTLCASGGGWGMKTGLYQTKNAIRKLTPIECERLQTLPDNYTAGISNTQRYKLLGNGFTVDVIAHILSFMNFN